MKRRTFLASLIPASAVIASKLHAQQPVPAEMPKGIWYDKAKNALHINQSSVRLDGDQGQLTLDGEPLEKYLPDFKAHELAIILGPKAEVLMIGKKAMEVLTTEAIHPTITSVTGEAQLRIESEALALANPETSRIFIGGGKPAKTTLDIDTYSLYARKEGMKIRDIEPVVITLNNIERMTLGPGSPYFLKKLSEEMGLTYNPEFQMADFDALSSATYDDRAPMRHVVDSIRAGRILHGKDVRLRQDIVTARMQSPSTYTTVGGNGSDYTVDSQPVTEEDADGYRFVRLPPGNNQVTLDASISRTLYYRTGSVRIVGESGFDTIDLNGMISALADDKENVKDLRVMLSESHEGLAQNQRKDGIHIVYQETPRGINPYKSFDLYNIEFLKIGNEAFAVPYRWEADKDKKLEAISTALQKALSTTRGEKIAVNWTGRVETQGAAQTNQR